MLLNFRVYRNGRVELLPSYPVTGVPRVSDARPTVPVMLDLYDREGRVIDSHRCHQHNPYQDPDGAYVDFHEVLPWRDDIGELVFVREREELHRVHPEEWSAPSLRIDGVRRVEGNEDHADLARVEWNLDSSDSQQTAALVRYTPDGGRTWYAVAEQFPGAAVEGRARHLVNLDLLPGGEDCRFEVIAANGLASVAVESESFSVRRKPRRAYLLSPQNGQTFRVGQPIEFVGAGHSPDHGLSPDESILWTSSLDGTLGSGSTLVRADLRPGRHRITLSTPEASGDENTNEATASVWIKVVERDPNSDDCPPQAS